jgi:hypothetical protein
MDPPHRAGTGLMGFKMAQGRGNRVVNCVCVGLAGQNGGDSSGFGWSSHEWGVWGFRNCVAHNNHNLGARFWLNDPAHHRLDGFVAYHNGRYGVFDGAYGNAVIYSGCTFHGNDGEGIHGKATSIADGRRTKALIGSRFDQRGRTEYCIEFVGHINDPEGRRSLLKGCSFRGATNAALGFTNVVAPSATVPDLIDIVDCTFDGNEFWLGSQIDPRSRIRVQDPIHGAIQLTRRDLTSEGELVEKWNARMKKIEPFA